MKSFPRHVIWAFLLLLWQPASAATKGGFLWFTLSHYPADKDEFLYCRITGNGDFAVMCARLPDVKGTLAESEVVTILHEFKKLCIELGTEKFQMRYMMPTNFPDTFECEVDDNIFSWLLPDKQMPKEFQPYFERLVGKLRAYSRSAEKKGASR